MAKNIVRRAISYVRPYATSLWFGQLAMLVSAAAGLALPLCSRYLVDGLTGHSPPVWIWWSVAALGASYLILSAAGYVRDRSLGTVSQYVTRDIRRQLYEKLALLSVPYVEATSSGELLSVMTNDINLFQEALAGGAMYVLTQLLSAVTVAVVMVKLDAPLTLMLCAVVPPAILVSRWSGQRARTVTERVQAELGRLTSVVTETIRGLDVVKAFVLRKSAAGIFAEQNERATSGSLRAVRIRAEGGVILGLLGGASLVLVVGVGSLHVARGRISAGDLVAYIVYAQMILGPLGTLSGIWVDIQRSFSAGRRIFGVLDAETEETARTVSGAPLRGALAHGRASGGRRDLRGDPGRPGGAEISIRGLWFRYRGSNPAKAGSHAIRGLDLTVAPGESVALVGPSGAGKSTLLKLLLRFYSPDRGEILFDGMALGDYDVEELRRSIALVMQETHLFDMSIRDNILCGDPQADEAAADKAARQAHAHEFVSRLPEGYATQIGENGARLSGGQRQRIALARAFLRRPRLLLLDEATSSLDTESERRVQDAMRRIMQGRTTIVIAHRLATVQRMDRILVMNRGRIVAGGTHRELLSSSPLYARLCRSQLLATEGGAKER